ncbi:MAG: hypothetical protein U0641_05280 [Anaerolineae bacterium]
MARKLVSDYAVFENVGGGRDIAFYYQDGGADSVTGISMAEADYIVSLLRHEKPISYDHALRRLSTPTPEPVGQGEVAVDLDAWLNAHPTIAGATIWQDGSGAHPWPSWSAAWKAELREAFDLVRARGSIAVPNVPANQVSLADDQRVIQVLAPADAWAYFKASVAQSLAVEVGQQVPWHLGEYSGDRLAQLLDSRAMFDWDAARSGYRIQETHGRVTPAPPKRCYEFLDANGLIGHDRLRTIALLVDWCRANLVHFSGDTFAANMEDQWQYRGFPPLTRVLDGTVQTSRPQLGRRHFTAGCWGTTGLLRAMLRTVNIPAKLVTNAGHAQPWFLADGRYLSHGDDPYNQLSRATPPIPAAELLIDQPQFEAWFGASVSASDKANNIGRRPRALAVVYLPDVLLQEHCEDTAAGRSHADSKVFATLSRDYTVAQLEAEHLWARLDTKVAGFGGCGHIPGE